MALFGKLFKKFRGSEADSAGTKKKDTTPGAGPAGSGPVPIPPGSEEDYDTNYDSEYGDEEGEFDEENVGVMAAGAMELGSEAPPAVEPEEPAEPSINPIAAQAHPGVEAGVELEMEHDEEEAAVAEPEVLPAPPAEELCDIDPETMDRDQIRAHLAVLYRRHNAAAASLNAELRAEAEQMLDAIVTCREKYVDLA